MMSVILLMAVILIPSCIDGQEEYWIEKNGSGRAEIRYTLPNSVANMQGGNERLHKIVSDFLKNTPAISQSSCEIITEESTTRVQIHARFDSALKLAEIANGPGIKSLPTAANHLVGEIQAQRHGRTVELTRTAAPAMAIPGVFWMPSSSLDGYKLTYIVHLPARASEANATRVDDGGCTLRWEIPLAQTINAPLVTHFKMDLPIPWTPFFAMGLPMFLLIFLGFSRIKNARKPRKTNVLPTKACPPSPFE
jgi:hypothetical protein